MKYAAAALLFVASIASAAQPRVVSRTTAYGPFTTTTPIPFVQRVLLQRAGETNFLIWSEQTTAGARIRVGPLTSTGIVDLAKVIELPVAYRDAIALDAASSGNEILVVWDEARVSPPGVYMADPFEYFGARIGSDGALLDRFPIPLGVYDSGPIVASPRDSVPPPHVAWNGSAFVVSWPIVATTVTPGGLSGQNVLLVEGLKTPLYTLSYWTGDTVDIGGSDGHALMIAQGLTEHGFCYFFGGPCYQPPATPRIGSFLFDANGVWGTAPLNLPFPSGTLPLAIGPASDGFVVAWNDIRSVRAIHVTAANGQLTTSDVSILAEYPSPTGVAVVRAANDLVVWNMFDGNPAIESTVGRLSMENEIASSPDVLWLGGDRYLVAYVSTGGASLIQLVTLDVTGRRRAVR